MEEIVKTAQDGYFLAKREMVEVIDRRVEFLKEAQSGFDNKEYYGEWTRIDYQIRELESVRNFVRNVMLWKNN